MAYINKEDKKEYQRKYQSTAEYKERRKEYLKEYNSRIGIKDKLKEYQRIWQSEHKEQAKEYYSRPEVRERHKDTCLQRRYGINIEQHRQMFADQGGRCAICGEKFINNKDAHTDHNHITHQVRQLLCRKHNILVSNCDEDIQILYKTIDYLNKHSANA
jgi:hypothetical protein